MYKKGAIYNCQHFHKCTKHTLGGPPPKKKQPKKTLRTTIFGFPKSGPRVVQHLLCNIKKCSFSKKILDYDR